MARNYTLKTAPVSPAGAVSSSTRRGAVLQEYEPGLPKTRKTRKSPCGRSDGPGAVSGVPAASGCLRAVGDPFPAPESASPGADRGAETAPGGAVSGLVICGISPRPDPPKPCADVHNRFLKFVYSEAPVIGFRVMKRDVLTVRAARDPDALAERLEGCRRGKIETLSMDSRRRLALVAANTHVIFRSFVTVTYPREFPCDGKDVKRHLSALLQALRRKCPGVSYLWFLEFQRRGAPHLHIFLSAAMPEPLSELHRKSGRVRKVVRTHRPWQAWLSSAWFEIVGSGDPKHLKAGAAWEVMEKPDGAAAYVAKESYKTFQKVVPAGFQNVGRFWGTSRDVPPDEGVLVRATEKQVKEIFPAGCFDSDGNPYPVLFGAAEAYEKIRDTAADPEKMRACLGAAVKDRIKRRQAIISTDGLFLDAIRRSGSTSAECLKVTGGLQATRKQRDAAEEWHGSTCGKQTGFSDTDANGG